MATYKPGQPSAIVGGLSNNFACSGPRSGSGKDSTTRFFPICHHISCEALETLVAWDQAQVTDASELLVLCFDTKAWAREPESYWRNAPKEVQDFLVPAIAQYYEGKPDVERDEGMRACGLAGMAIMLMAKELGYDSCPMDGFDYKAVADIIKLPPDYEIAYMIAIGKGTKAAWPKPGQLLLDQVMVEDRFDG